jgi:hypothetical protein
MGAVDARRAAVARRLCARVAERHRLDRLAGCRPIIRFDCDPPHTCLSSVALGSARLRSQGALPCPETDKRMMMSRRWQRASLSFARSWLRWSRSSPMSTSPTSNLCKQTFSLTCRQQARHAKKSPAGRGKLSMTRRPLADADRPVPPRLCRVAQQCRPRGCIASKMKGRPEGRPKMPSIWKESLSAAAIAPPSAPTRHPSDASTRWRSFREAGGPSRRP